MKGYPWHSPVLAFFPTMQGFVTHWAQANAVLSAAPLLLKNGYTLANLQADTTAAGLSALGSVTLFKVYAVTATGRERASPTLKVTRP